MEIIETISKGQVILTTKTTGEELLKVSMAHGARLTQLRLKGQDGFRPVLWNVSDEDLAANAWYKNVILFPYANRLEDGKFKFDGKSYQFPINEPATNNQLHGMLFDAPFELEQSHLASGSITLVHHYAGQLAYYPFPFTFRITYTHKGNSLLVRMEVTNEGNARMPYGIGWHPYFKLNSGDMLDYSLTLPHVENFHLSERSLPTGPVAPFDSEVTFQDQNLDHVFRIIGDQRSCVLTDRTCSDKLVITGSSNMTYLQVFTPENQGTIAIEPMTCNINAFNNGLGLGILDAGNSVISEIEVLLK